MIRNRVRFRSVFTAACALTCLAVVFTPPRLAAAQGDGGSVRLRRFALLVGVNDGGPSRARLRYAASDARAVGRVLQTLGGVAPGDMVAIADASRAALLAGFVQVDRLLQAGATPGVRRVLLVYYSGHSDEEGLLLGRDRVSYDELRAHMNGAPAELRVAILDSCASGAFMRRKGGERRPPFLLDTSIDTRGHAFLTSSAANEVAQESDRIAASFFTYYLLSGLRGAADVNQDHRVTLQEAFQFASQETLARTERTQGGPQHAAYEFDLTGTGDMVVTDVRITQAALVLTPDLSGRISVREAGGALVAELRKPAGNTIELGLESGSYVVAMESGATTFEAHVTLASGERAPLARMAFHPGAPREVAMARGDAPAGDIAAAAATAPAAHEQTPFKAGVIPRAVDGRTDVDGFSFGFIADRVARLHGFELALGYAQVDQEMTGMQLAVGAAMASGRLRGLQLTAGANILQGDGVGVQITAGANVALGDLRGLQIAGGVNAVSGELRGLQIAGGVNMADRAVGLQLAPLNYARQGRGMQLGVVNVGADNTGMRLGVINVTRESRGFQLGVINVAAKDDGESFAVINLIGNGIHDVAVFASDALLSNVALKLGSRHLYTVLGVGYQPGDELAAGSTHFQRGTRRWGTMAGAGWRFPLAAGRLEYAELEADATNVREAFVFSGGNALLSSLRAQVGARLAPHVALLAGLAANVAVGTDGHDLDLAPAGLGSVTHSGATTVRIYPGFLLGLQI